MKELQEGDLVWVKAEVCEYSGPIDSTYALCMTNDSEQEIMCADSLDELSRYVDEDVRDGHAVYHSKALDNALKKAEKDAVKNTIKVKQKEIAELEKKLKEL